MYFLLSDIAKTLIYYLNIRTVSCASCAPLPSDILVSSLTAIRVQLSPSISLL